jgi:sec-independent protein translocase protein TatA
MNFIGSIFFAIGLPGSWEWFLIILLVLLLFGGKRIPSLARDLGKGIREFKDAITGKEKEQLDEKKESDTDKA